MISQEDIRKLQLYRGNAWVSVFKSVDESDYVESIRSHLLSLKDENGVHKVTPRDVAESYIMFNMFGIAGRTYFRFLEGPVLPKGVYQRLINRGLKWSKLIDDMNGS